MSSSLLLIHLKLDIILPHFAELKSVTSNLLIMFKLVIVFNMFGESLLKNSDKFLSS